MAADVGLSDDRHHASSAGPRHAAVRLSAPPGRAAATPASVTACQSRPIRLISKMWSHRARSKQSCAGTGWTDSKRLAQRCLCPADAQPTPSRRPAGGVQPQKPYSRHRVGVAWGSGTAVWRRRCDVPVGKWADRRRNLSRPLAGAASLGIAAGSLLGLGCALSFGNIWAPVCLLAWQAHSDRQIHINADIVLAIRQYAPPLTRSPAGPLPEPVAT